MSKVKDISQFRKVGQQRAPSKIDKESGHRLDGIEVGRSGDKVEIRWARPATSIRFKVHEAVAFANAILNSAGILTVSNPDSPPPGQDGNAA